MKLKNVLLATSLSFSLIGSTFAVAAPKEAQAAKKIKVLAERTAIYDDIPDWLGRYNTKNWSTGNKNAFVVRKGQFLHITSSLRDTGKKWSNYIELKRKGYYRDVHGPYWIKKNIKSLNTRVYVPPGTYWINTGGDNVDMKSTIKLESY